MPRLIVDLPDSTPQTMQSLLDSLATLAAAGTSLSWHAPPDAGGVAHPPVRARQTARTDGVSCTACGARNQLLERDRGIDDDGREVTRVNTLQSVDGGVATFATQFEVLYADWETDGYTCGHCGADAILPADLDVITGTLS